MKTKKEFLLIVLVFSVITSLFITSCEDNDVVNKPKPIVLDGEAYAEPTLVLWGGTTTIYYKSSNATKIMINDEIVSVNNGLWNSKTFTVTETTNFTVKFVNGAKNLLSDLKVDVTPLEPRTIMLTKDKYWMMVSAKSYNYADKYWSYAVLDADQLSRKFYYYPDGRLIVKNQAGVQVDYDFWTWVGAYSLNYTRGQSTPKYELTEKIYIESVDKGTYLVVTEYKSYEIPK